MTHQTEEVRARWDKAMEPVLDEQFPKDNEGVEHLRPSHSRRGAALVLYAKAFIFMEKEIARTRTTALQEGEEKCKRTNFDHYLAEKQDKLIAIAREEGKREERVKTLNWVREQIEESYIRKNDKNSLMYGVEIDNYNMALDDLLEVLNGKSTSTPKEGK